MVLPYGGKHSLFGESTRQKHGTESTNYGSTSDDFKNYSSIVKNMFKVQNYSLYDPPFAWAQSSPMVYVQQIMLRTSVFPWTEDMNLMDAFRSPMYEVFKLLEIVRNHENEERLVFFFLFLLSEEVNLTGAMFWIGSLTCDETCF